MNPLRTLIPLKYRSKPLKWWFFTPLYAWRIFRHKCIPSQWSSQNGEDRVLAGLFKSQQGYCVEVGALDGISISNTYYFERKRKAWKCLLVEADPTSATQCKENRPNSIVFSAAATSPELVGEMSFLVIEHNRAMSGVSFDEFQIRHFEKHKTEFSPKEVKIEARTLDSMLEEAEFTHIDFITIDVEGHEFAVLEGFTINRWQPKVVVLERLKSEPDPEIAAYMSRHGYVKRFNLPRKATDDCNDFYFREALPAIEK